MSARLKDNDQPSISPVIFIKLLSAVCPGPVERDLTCVCVCVCYSRTVIRHRFVRRWGELTRALLHTLVRVEVKSLHTQRVVHRGEGR